VKARFLKAAREELIEEVRYYDAQRAGLGAELRNEVRSAVDRIRAFPEAWQSLDTIHRRCRTRRFPYGVIYRLERDEILIVAFAHLHQKPRSWEDQT
jgi:plasmid stabilization system protein ParE